jgi:hypothetical protein
MAKSKEKKPKPKPPEGVATVVAIKKTIEDRKAKLAKRKTDATKDGKFNKTDPKYRVALKRLKRAQRKLQAEAWRLKPKKAPVAAAAAAAPAAAEAAPAAAAPAEGEKK